MQAYIAEHPDIFSSILQNQDSRYIGITLSFKYIHHNKHTLMKQQLIKVISGRIFAKNQTDTPICKGSLYYLGRTLSHL